MRTGVLDNCYTLEHIPYQQGILDNIIDAVFVIMLKGTPREPSVRKQLQQYKLSKNNYILVNHGYKNCSKDLYEQQPRYDLMHCYYQILKLSRHMNNILILEDDFIFDERITTTSVIRDLEAFILHNEFELYSLGKFCWLSSPLTMFSTHKKCLWSTTTHADILSKTGRDTVMAAYEKDQELRVSKSGGLHDAWLNTVLSTQYLYHKPVCYQTFPMTENRKYWDNWLHVFLCDYLLQLDKHPLPGFDRLYRINTLLTIVVYFISVIMMGYVGFKTWTTLFQ